MLDIPPVREAQNAQSFNSELFPSGLYTSEALGGCVGVEAGVAAPRPSISFPPSILAYTCHPHFSLPPPGHASRQDWGRVSGGVREGQLVRRVGRGGGSFKGRIIPLVELFENTSKNLLYDSYFSSLMLQNFFLIY